MSEEKVVIAKQDKPHEYYNKVLEIMAQQLEEVKAKYIIKLSKTRFDSLNLFSEVQGRIAQLDDTLEGCVKLDIELNKQDEQR